MHVPRSTSADSRSLLSKLPQRRHSEGWLIDPDEISVCKRVDGSDHVLGTGSSGKVRFTLNGPSSSQKASCAASYVHKPRCGLSFPAAHHAMPTITPGASSSLSAAVLWPRGSAKLRTTSWLDCSLVCATAKPRLFDSADVIMSLPLGSCLLVLA